jgi:hypothetical protein
VHGVRTAPAAGCGRPWRASLCLIHARSHRGSPCCPRRPARRAGAGRHVRRRRRALRPAERGHVPGAGWRLARGDVARGAGGRARGPRPLHRQRRLARRAAAPGTAGAGRGRERRHARARRRGLRGHGLGGTLRLRGRLPPAAPGRRARRRHDRLRRTQLAAAPGGVARDGARTAAGGDIGRARGAGAAARGRRAAARVLPPGGRGGFRATRAPIATSASPSSNSGTARASAATSKPPASRSGPGALS